MNRLFDTPTLDNKRSVVCKAPHPCLAIQQLENLVDNPFLHQRKITLVLDLNRIDDYDLKTIRKDFKEHLGHIIATPNTDLSRPFHIDFFANEPLGDEDAFWSEEEQRRLFRHRKNPFIKKSHSNPLSKSIRRAFSNVRARLPPRRYVYRVNDF